MPTFAFKGGPVLTLDAKGRIAVPARWRDELMATVNGQLVICKSQARCLSLYPKVVWDDLEAALHDLPTKDEAWVRVLIGSAVDVEIDAASRVLIPPELRAWAGLERDVIFMGMRDKFELWDTVRYDGAEAVAFAAGMPESLAQRKPSHSRVRSG